MSAAPRPGGPIPYRVLDSILPDVPADYARLLFADPQSRAVLNDWLHQHGHPRADVCFGAALELAQLELRLKRAVAVLILTESSGQATSAALARHVGVYSNPTNGAMRARDRRWRAEALQGLGFARAQGRWRAGGGLRNARAHALLAIANDGAPWPAWPCAGLQGALGQEPLAYPDVSPT